MKARSKRSSAGSRSSTKKSKAAGTQGRAGNPKSPAGVRWLLQPPEPGHLHIRFAAGDGVKLPLAARDALEALITTLHQSDTRATAATGGPDPSCGDKKLNCHPLDKCLKETQGPCLVDYDCRIKG